jgi:hypothetical protein
MRLGFFLDFSCTRNAACYNCAPQPNQVIQFTPGRQKSLQMARIGFAISKMRRRFGAGFMIGLDGLNVPAPAQFLKIHPKKSFAIGSSQVRRNLLLGQPQSATGQYASSKREKAIHGPEIKWRTIFFKYKQVMSHSPRNL